MHILNKYRHMKSPRMLTVNATHFTEQMCYLLSEHGHQHIYPRSCEELLIDAFTFRIFASTREKNRFFFFTHMFNK